MFSQCRGHFKPVCPRGLEKFCENKDHKSNQIFSKRRFCKSASLSLYFAINFFMTFCTVSSKPPSQRLQEEFSWLRNDTFNSNFQQLEQEIQKNKVVFKELPLLAENRDFLPKENWKRTETTRLPVFLNKQRLTWLREIQNFLKTGGLDSLPGRVVSGPHGCGKSALLYLAASVAYVNYCPQIYIPRCKVWTRESLTQDYNGMQFVLNRALDLNEGVEELAEILEIAQEATDSADPKKISNAYTILLRHFSSLKRSNFIILDEHNELFRETFIANQKVTPAQFPLFQPYCSFTGLSGANTFLIYGGSAHSKIENNLQSGLQQVLWQTSPLTKEEMQTVVECDPELSFASYWSVPSLNKQLFMDKLYWVTGGMPRELRDVKAFCNKRPTTSASDLFEHVEMWAAAQTNTFFKRLQVLWNDELTDSYRSSFLQQLESLFAGPLTGYLSTDAIVGAFYDKGLLYAQERSGGNAVIKPISGPAQRALMELYARQVKIEPVDAAQDPIERGKRYERQAIKQLISLGCLSGITAYHLPDDKGFCKAATLKYPRPDYQEDFSISNLHLVNQNIDRNIAYIPDISNFRAFDYIIDIRKQFIEAGITPCTIFVQQKYPNAADTLTSEVPKENLLVQYGKTFAIAFKQMEAHNQRNIIEVILDTIRGKTGHKAQIDPDGRFIITTPEGQPYSALFVIGSAAPEDEIKSKLEHLRSKKMLAKLPDVLFYGRTASEHLGIFFGGQYKSRVFGVTLKKMTKTQLGELCAQYNLKRGTDRKSVV